MATSVDFTSLLNGFYGKGWPYFDFGQEEFLKSCPVNKKGWHFYQIPGGPVIHFKTGIDFRNPSVPYRIVKVNGLKVYSLIGHKHRDQVYFGRVGDRIYATLGVSTMWMPKEGYAVSPEAFSYYRRHFSADFYCMQEIVTQKDQAFFWGANVGFHGSSENSLRQSVETKKGYLRCANQGMSEYMDFETALQYLEGAISEYVQFMHDIKLKIDEIM